MPADGPVLGTTTSTTAATGAPRTVAGSGPRHQATVGLVTAASRSSRPGVGRRGRRGFAHWATAHGYGVGGRWSSDPEKRVLVPRAAAVATSATASTNTNQNDPPPPNAVHTPPPPRDPPT